MNQTTLPLDQVSQFFNEIGMKSGDCKCWYMVVERGKVINNITVNPMKKGDSYKYLGFDGNLGCVRPVQKARVTNEYW